MNPSKNIVILMFAVLLVLPSVLAVSLTVSTTGTGAGSIKSSPQRLSCSILCSEEFDVGSTVTLVASPSHGSVFAGWSGDCSGQDPTCTLEMDKAKQVTAEFSRGEVNTTKYRITATTTGDGAGTITTDPPKMSCSIMCSEEFDAGSYVDIRADPSSGSSSPIWITGCTGNANGCVMRMDSDKFITVQFDKIKTGGIRLTNASTNGIVSAVSDSPSDCTGTGFSCPYGLACGNNSNYMFYNCYAFYREGTIVTLTATPVEGAAFAGWSGACQGVDPACSLIADPKNEKAATAVFEEPQDSRGPIFVNFSGRGIVTSARDVQANCTGKIFGCLDYLSCGNTSAYEHHSCAAYYERGAKVVLTAVPKEGNVFGGWSGACQGVDPICTVIIDPRREIIVHPVFEEPADARGLVLIESASSSGIIAAKSSFPANCTGKDFTCWYGISCGNDGENMHYNCAAYYERGTEIIMNITPVEGMVFTGWKGACQGPQLNCTLIADPRFPGRINATFEPSYSTLVVENPMESGIIESKIMACRNENCDILCGDGNFQCSSQVMAGTNITLVALPKNNSVFSEWRGSCKGKKNSCVVSVKDAPLRIIPVFIPKVEFKVSVAKAGLGLVKSSPVSPTVSSTINCGASCSSMFINQTKIVLNAYPARGYYFARWQGACNGNSTKCVILVDDSKSARAIFQKSQKVTKKKTGAAR